MRIRITEVDYVDVSETDDKPLSYWGLTVGDEFEVCDVVDGAFVIKCDVGYVVVYHSECVILEG